MYSTRRQALFWAASAGLASIVGSALPADAAPENYLWGTWYVRCPDGHDDKVEKGTAQHKCETCGKQCFKDGKVVVVCPKGHPNEIEVKGRVESAKCKHEGCGVECRRDK